MVIGSPPSENRRYPRNPPGGLGRLKILYSPHSWMTHIYIVRLSTRLGRGWGEGKQGYFSLSANQAQVYAATSITTITIMNIVIDDGNDSYS